MLKIIRYLIFIPIIYLIAGYLLANSNHYQQAKLAVDNTVLNVEEATTSSQQTLGLSYRNNLAKDHGMLFIFNKEQPLGFWMKDMHFPLDIIWLNSHWQIVHVEQNLTPCANISTCRGYTPSENAQYVVEVNAGFVKSNQIKLGDQFTLMQ